MKRISKTLLGGGAALALALSVFAAPALAEEEAALPEGQAEEAAVAVETRANLGNEGVESKTEPEPEPKTATEGETESGPKTADPAAEGETKTEPEPATDPEPAAEDESSAHEEEVAEGPEQVATAQASTDTITMFRFYNPNSGEHFYTSSQAEAFNLVNVGWNYEGFGWIAPKHSDSPVYRLYNPNAGDHHYTLSAEERDHLVSVGWNFEGIGWYSDDAKSVALLRQYNPNAVAGAHNFTTSKAENDHLASVGWSAEGIGWYAVADGSAAPHCVYLDAGHGWSSGIYDSGAQGSGYSEATETKELATKVAAYARQLGVNLFLNSDEGSAGVDYTYRQADAISRGCTSFVAIHFNATGTGTGTGSESYIHSVNANRRSAGLQDIMHLQLTSSLGLVDRGQHAAEFAVVSGRGGRLPSTLLEICFIDNSYDMSVYKSREDQVARALARGLKQAIDAGY